MLSGREPISQLSIVNPRPQTLNGPQLLHELVRTTPGTDVPAIDFLEDGTKRRFVTYADLHALSDTLARKISYTLQRLESVSAVVPVILPQSPELYITLLAILKAGKAFCPIGLDVPPERLAFILKDVSAELIITDSLRKGMVSSSVDLSVLLIDRELPSTEQDTQPSPNPVLPHQLAYVLYTSGSTGLPKAVSVSHHAVSQSLLAHDRHIPAFSRFLQFAAPTFDVSIFEIFFPLFRGCTLVGCTRARLLNDLPMVIGEMAVDAAELTPTVVSNLLQGRQSVPRLKLLLTIGEMLTQNVIDEFGGRGSKESILWGMYGPTEAAIHCTLQPRFSCDSPVGNIGYPLDTVSVFIATPDPEGCPNNQINVLPVGAIGELVVGGSQIADGYLNRPELTAASFIQDPRFGCLYRTGDKARLHPDGTLECLGRIVSGQVKLRGQRVELGEIEKVIMNAALCHSTAVMVVDDILIAFCAIGSGSVSKMAIIEACKHFLPSYMVPTEVILLQKMPQLASGKVDKKCLAARYKRELQQGDLLAPQPMDPVELTIITALSRSLGHPISLATDLGSVGLDSLRSIRLASSLRDLGFNVASMDLLSAANLEDLITLVKESRNRQNEAVQNFSILPDMAKNIPELQAYESEIEEILPCTPLQEAMLAETTVKPSAYCNWVEIELPEPQNLLQLRRLLEALAQQNEILRTGFCAPAMLVGSFSQVIWKQLSDSSIREVTSFSRKYSLGSAESLLRPFTVQLLANPAKPRLLFQMHHALYDGWSFDLLLQDLNRLLANRTIESRPQYREVLRYHLQFQDSEKPSSSRTYWAELMHGYQPTQLPNFNGKLVRNNSLRSFRKKSAVNGNVLFNRAAELGINPQVFFQAAAACIFGLYLGRSDVVIGTVTSGRSIPVTHIESIIGPCIASLPFRVDTAKYPTIKDLLLQTQKANRGMIQHCDLPLRDITKLCNLRPGERLFDVLFVWQQSLAPDDDQDSSPRIVDSEDDLEFTVTLEFEPLKDYIRSRITYDPSLVPESQVKHLSSQIDGIVNHFLLNIDGLVEQAHKYIDTESLSIANSTPTIELFQYGLSRSVEKRALETPHCDAVIVGAIADGQMCIKDKVTYSDLNARANRLAHALIEYGAGNDQLICVLLEKSTDLYVSILAVLKTGCGYLPVVPDTPPERIKRILEDAGVTLCISKASIYPNGLLGSLNMLDLDTFQLALFAEDNLNIPYNGSHLAYAVFTSGSTGRPKGVLVSQDNLMSNLVYLASLYPNTGGARILQSCSQAFDVSVFEIFFSWYAGMCLCTATKDELFQDFESAIDRLGITHLSLTPTVAGLVDPNKVPKVQFLVTAGEALTESVRRKWAGKNLFQGYGPSETTNICTVNPNVSLEDLINNIGAPFDNTSAFVLRPDGDSILPRGAVGELCFGGAQVFRGYLNMPELNTKKIITHPTYGRIYRSGDMGLLLPNNSILFTGRLDDQVKVRGQRVELNEITSTVLDHHAIKDCTTLLLQGESGVQKLVTFWVPTRVLTPEFDTLSPIEYRSTTLDVFESLAVRLPPYMVPTHLIPITRIPMTRQGKVDKQALRALFDGLPNEYLASSVSYEDSTNDVEPFSEHESKIAEALSRTVNLPLEEIRRSSSFFHLGLDSVSAIAFARRLKEVGFDHLLVSTIMKNPTVERLSPFVATRDGSEHTTQGAASTLPQVFNSDDLKNIRAQFKENGVKILKILPCTPLQEAMLSSNSGSSPAYFNTTTFKVNGQIDLLKECWELMVQRHEILRTAFVSTENHAHAYAQVVLEYKRIEWDMLSLDDDLSALIKPILAKELDLHRPPIRLAVVESGQSRRLIFCCHHALYDGTAISILLDEVEKLYKGVQLLQPIQFERYLQHITSQDLEAADHFWSDSFAGFEPTYFPDITIRTQKSEPRSFLVEKKLQMSLTNTLEFCQSSSLSLLTVVQAAWAKVLHFLVGGNDLCFGNIVSGRTLPEDGIDRLVAPCFNTVPVRLEFDFQKPNLELCRRLHSLHIDSIPFHLTPLRRIQSKVATNRGQLFDTLVLLQQPTTTLDDSIWSLEHDDGEMDVPIVCEVWQDRKDDSMKLILHYKDSLLFESDAEILAAIFDHALQSLVRFPKSCANDTVGFPSRLLGQCNMDFGQVDPPHCGLLHSAFELNAKAMPDTIALDFLHANGERTALTFSALNEKANQIAHALLRYGVQPEDIVPLHIAKSPEFYAGILGILKAGAAFAPIHPELPKRRKCFMVSELRPKVILFLGNTLEWTDSVPSLDVSAIKGGSNQNPVVQGLRPTNLAYCLYTSGSTGIPKAVSMEHRSPVQTIESSRSRIPWNNESRLLQFAAITFDMCYYDCFLAWTFGFTLCAATQEVMLNNLTDTANALSVHLLDLTPSVAASLRRAELPTVKWLYCIGEAMTADVIKEWTGASVNSYGPTEAAFCTTIFPTGDKTKTSVIGKPFPTTSFAVFPSQGERPIPVLGVGELYIGGTQLARGYYGQPELTEAKFVQKCGQRFYKSGDMVRMLSSGNFTFQGRADDQVKIRGQRVELGEINQVLQDCDRKISAVSTQILRQNSDAKDQLVAFLVAQCPLDGKDQDALKSKAQQAAKAQLPSYMVPQFFVFVNRIPRSMAGKVDKKALELVFRETKFDVQEHDPGASAHHWTEDESQIREVFSKFSKTPLQDVSPHATIYQLGLDSISAVQIAAALRRQGRQVNASDIMKHTSCKDLAKFLGQARSPLLSEIATFNFESFEAKHRAAIVACCIINDYHVEAIRPCTPLQCGMLSQFIARDGGIYYNYIRLRLRSDSDLLRMKDAWSRATQRHSILRTGFAHIKDRKTPFAMIRYAPGASPLPWEDTDANHEVPSSVEEWLEDSQRKALKDLHLPPWRLRITVEDGVTCLDLGILHAIFDAQSLRFILDDTEALYVDKPTATPSALDPLLGNILHMSSTEQVPQANFWEELGKNCMPTRFPNLTPLRCDPAPPIILRKQSSRSLDEFDGGCRKANISLQVAAIASWASLLSSYTGEPCVTFGIVLSGRNIDGAESAVFPCITTVPFVCQVSDDKGRLLQQVLNLNADVQRHQFMPLNEIQRLMGYPNEPVFDSVFAFQKTLSEGSDTDLWEVVDERATIEYPISIELEPKDGRLEYRLTFLPHVIPREHAALILDQLDHLLSHYVFSDELSGVKQAEAAPLYSITPPKDPTIPSEIELLHDLVELTAALYPYRTALEFADSIYDGGYTSRKWTYKELDEEGNRIAHLLISLGIHPGELVGVCFDKCPEASFAILGVLKAGCAFVALDPGAPSARKSFIVEDSGAKVVLSMKSTLRDITVGTGISVINLDELKWGLYSAKKPHLEREVRPHDRSYCLYTSGTTGTPKGCELTHENAVQALLSFRRLFDGHWNIQSRWFQFASFHFDVSVLEQYWSWSVGICVVSAPRDLIFEDLARSIRILDITHIDLTPSLARILDPDDVPSLCKGIFITGGESLIQEILDVWGPKGVIYNGYGPTEATIGVTMYPRVPANGKPSNIGPQFDNVGSYVLRPGSDVPVLRGGVGELCVSGKLVGKGYLNRPDLTKERFPTLEGFNERVYRTGDLVRILHDGTFDFLGRADDQVKLRGQRLEIGEINAVIKQSGVPLSDVVTLVLKHPKQQKEQLVSFVVATSNRTENVRIVLEKSNELEKARQACAERLPPYMVPTHFVALTKMPLSPNNKVEARRLKEMYAALSAHNLQMLSHVSQDKVDQWTRQELKIREVVAETLEVNNAEFTKDASFFELGMDSISAIGVSTALKRAGFSKAAVSTIMRHATIRRLAKLLSERSLLSDERGSIIAAQQSINATRHRYRRLVAEVIFTDPRNIEALAPCTPLQQGMIARSLDSEHGLYFNAFYFRLNYDQDSESRISTRIQEAWEHAYSSTEILRTVFVNTEDGFVQAILRKTSLKFLPVSLPDDDTLDHSLETRRREWAQRNRDHIKFPFELMLVETPERKMLVVHIFHALYDGNSIGLIFKSVWDAYNHALDERGSGASFHSTLAYGPLRPIEGAKPFWEKHLLGTKFKPFPALTSEPDQAPTAVTREVRNLANFETVRRKLNVTGQAIAQACWTAILHRHIKGPVTVGMVVSGRSMDLDGADRVIGPLFNTIPYYYQPQQRDTWTSTIRKAHELNIAAHPYQHTPLRDIIKWCKPGGTQPLFDTLFVYQIADDNRECIKNDVWELLVGGTEADYPLAIEVEQRSDETMMLTLVTQGHISDKDTSNTLLDEFEEALRDALATPEAALPIASDADCEDTNTAAQNDENNNAPAVEILDGARDFEWTSQATILREEIANLANTDVLGMDETTSFFELGLDSIDAIKLSSKLRKRRIDLPVSSIIRSLSITNMLRHIVTNKKNDNERPSDMIFKSHKRRLERYLQHRGLAEGVDQILPLTPLQEAMVAEMIASKFLRYYNHDVLKLGPDTNIEQLRGAWTEVVRRSPILRTSFLQIDDPGIDFSFAQVVHQDPHSFWKDTEVEGELNFSAIFDAVRQDAVSGSALEPLFSVRLVRSSGHAYIILSIAHALYDGWSLSLLHADVHKAYSGTPTTRPSYEQALLEILTASGSDAASFWRDYLSDAKFTGFQRRTLSDRRRQLVIHRKEQVSAASLSDISSFARKNNISLQTLGQTVYGLTLASYTRSLDVTFGSVLSGRDDEERGRLLFPTMNTVAVRTVLHGHRRDMLQYVRENFSNIKQWQHFPLRRALALVGAQGSLFESLFIYQKSAANDNNEQQRLYESIEGRSDVEYPVCVEMEAVGERLIWRCAVSEEIFDESGTQELLSTLDLILGNIMKNPHAHTIEFSATGTSICGLPAFEEVETEPPKEVAEDEKAQASSNESITAKTIREVLAFASKIPEEEIVEGMTIFHLGLDSISAIKVASLLRKRGIVLSVGEMLRAGTVERMTQMVEERGPELGISDKADAQPEKALERIDRPSLLKQAGIDESDVEEVFPATAGQVYMLSMWLRSEGKMFYPDFAYRLHGSITLETLRSAWQALVATNPILRTCLYATDLESTPYVQVVLRKSHRDVPQVTNWDEEPVNSEGQKTAATQPFAHLLASPLSGGWDLKLKIHHALYDGVSLPVMMEQLQDLCNGVNLPQPLNTFNKLLAKTTAPSALEHRNNFWRTYLKGIKQYPLPQPPSASSSKIEIFKPALIPDMAPLNILTRKHGITIQSLFLAVFAKLYAYLSSTPPSNDVVIGMYLANRSMPLPHLAAAPFPTVNLVPLRVCAPREAPLWDVAAQIQYDVQEISGLANATVGLWEVSEWTGVRVDAFVNFLSLPDGGGERRDEQEGVRIRPVGQWDEGVERLIEMKRGRFEVPAGMMCEAVNAAYQHAIDVEVTVRDGRLDVGVFAGEAMLGLEEGRKLMEDIRLELETVAGKAEV